MTHIGRGNGFLITTCAASQSLAMCLARSALTVTSRAATRLRLSGTISYYGELLALWLDGDGGVGCGGGPAGQRIMHNLLRLVSAKRVVG